MPLLRKQPFDREQPPGGLKPDSEVFYCRITKEIFTDYESFFERIILCNSLVWSCSITGKSGLTYQEAIESEEKAKKNLASFPVDLQKPILYLATRTHRSRLNDLNDDVFVYSKERYFLGEVVDVLINQQRRTCEIIKVTAPPPNDSKNGDVIVIDDEDEDVEMKSPKSNHLNMGPECSQYKYTVKEKKGGATSIARAANISRKRGLFTRDKNKLFLKLHCEPVDGIWTVKDESIKKFKLNTCSFGEFFNGPLPSFAVSAVKKKSAAKRPSDAALNQKDTPPSKKSKPTSKDKSNAKDSPKTNPFLPDYGVDQETLLKLPPEERGKLREKVKQEKLAEKLARKEEMKKKLDEIKQKKKEEKAKEREEQRKERYKQLEIQREYNRVRDDLECDDLKLMPEFTPVSTRLPSQLFGEAMNVLEFTHSFKTMFDFKQFFPKGFTYGMLESALLDNDTDGPLCDLLQMLLVAIFTLQEEEAEEVSELETDQSIKDDDQDESRTNQLIDQATMAAQIPQMNHGMPLKKLLLDQFTLTEILRLHLMSAGSKTTVRNARFRYQQRGGYTSLDDAGLDFKITDMELLKTLSMDNVYDLSPDSKLKIISVLLNQILSYAAIRDLIDESHDRLRQLRYDLKQIQWAEQRREREELAARNKHRQEEKILENRIKLLQEREKIQQEKGLSVEGETDLNENLMDLQDKILTPEEKANRDKKEQEKEAKKKAEFQKKEEDLINEIMELQQTNAIYPLGRDRMYRRYWLFKAMQGVFVEDEELFVDEDAMFPGSKKIKNSQNGHYSAMDVDKSNTSSDKENDLCTDTKSDCIVISDDDSRSIQSVDSKSESVKEEEAIKWTPALKQIKDRTKSPWSFVAPGCLDELLETLNPRGIRESHLKHALTELRPVIVKSLDQCNTEDLCVSAEHQEEARLKALSLTRGIASIKAAQDTVKRDTANMELELNLRDAILDLEDRMFIGTLGSIKVDNRFAWRAQIDANAPENNDSNDSKPECDRVKELSQALYDISVGIEQRYLTQPLKDSDSKKKSTKDKKKKKAKEEEIKDDDSDGDNKEEEKKKSTFDKWQESLLNVSSLSQIYVYLSTLDKSVMWDKSALHAKCRICRRKGDAERMLLCDGCDRGHHMDCLKPPVKKVPVGDWYCPNCRPKEVVIRSPRKGRRRTFSEEEDEDESTVDEDSEEVTSEVEQDTEEESDEENEESSIDENENVCFVCEKKGMLICCDCCPKSYHLACAIPPLKKIPRGKWLCQDCLGYNKVGKVKFGQKAKKSTNLSLLSGENTRSSPASTPKSITKGDSDDDTPNRSTKSRKSTPRSATRDKEESAKKLYKSGSRGNLKIQQLKSLQELVGELVKHEDSWPFLKPVSKREVPDYYKVIKEPMDFQTIKNKIYKLEYSEPSQIVADIKLIFFNCVEYNNRNTPQYKSGTILNKYFQKRVKELELGTDDYLPPPNKKSKS